jgi:hypothetical protein
MSEKKTKNNHLDWVLIKLKRRYTKDETVSALAKKLSEVEIELGKAISYIQELEYGKENSKENLKLHLEIKRLKKSNDELIYKYLRK